jgi:hypothetical protein
MMRVAPQTNRNRDLRDFLYVLFSFIHGGEDIAGMEG